VTRLLSWSLLYACYTCCRITLYQFAVWRVVAVHIQGRQHSDEVFPRHQEQHQAPLSTGRRRRVPAELHLAARRADARHCSRRVFAAVALHRLLSQRRFDDCSSPPLCLVDRRRRRRRVDSRPVPPSRRWRRIASVLYTSVRRKPHAIESRASSSVEGTDSVISLCK